MRNSPSLLALALLLVSCASAPTKHEPNLVGLHTDEILQSWGEPIRRDPVPEGERWTYRMQRMTTERTRTTDYSEEYLPFSRDPETIEQSLSFSSERVAIEYIGHLIFSEDGVVVSATPGTPLR